MVRKKSKSPAYEFTIRGDLRITVNGLYRVGGDKAAQILCYADVEYKGELSENVLLLKLDVQGSSDTQWTVMDGFPPFLPYMKPVRAFREYLICQLESFRRSFQGEDLSDEEGTHRFASHYQDPFSPLWMGIGRYTSELKEFSETRCLLGEVKRGADSIMRDMRQGRSRYDDKFVQTTLRRLLRSFGAESATEQKFFVK